MPMKKITGVLLLASLIIGCGRSDLPDLGSVSGVITVNEKPLSNAIVNFTPTGPGRPSTAVTDAAGRYSLIYLQDVGGAIVGEHVVTLELVTTEEMDNLPDDPNDLDPGQSMPQELPASASDGSIKKEVKPGGNSIDIDL